MDERGRIFENIYPPGLPRARDGRRIIDYRLYILDASGYVSRGIDINFFDDAEAISYAKTIGSAHGMELWQGKRMTREFLPGE
jgi:hypothetical protein